MARHSENRELMTQRFSCLEENISTAMQMLTLGKYFNNVKYFPVDFTKKNIFSDPVQLNLLYEQAKEAILDGTHPVPLETAVQFGALQVQIQFGDHREDKHKPGMLAE